MTVNRKSRWVLWIVGTLAVLAGVTVIGLHLATQALKTKVEAALGPRSEVGEIKASFNAIEVVDLRIKAPEGWPSADELRAKRIVVKPDLRALFEKNIRVGSIRIEDAYLSMLRGQDGKVVLLPSLLGTAAAGKDEAGKEKTRMPPIRIGQILLGNAAVEFFDASVRQPAIKLRLEQVNASIGGLLLPDLTGLTPIKVEAAIKGASRDGRLDLAGEIEFASNNSELNTRLHDVDLVTFQPYLSKAAETGVKKGTLNFALKSTVKENHLHAPGTLTLADLELTPGSTFLGMPREAVVAMMKEKRRKITVNFILEGYIDDPKFSLNEHLASRIGSSIAGAFGISLEGLAKDGSAVKGVGEELRKMLGK